MNNSIESKPSTDVTQPPRISSGFEFLLIFAVLALIPYIKRKRK